MSRDPLGALLRRLPQFPGEHVLRDRWLRRVSGTRRRELDGGFALELDMGVPYEATVWLGKEENDGLAFLRRALRPGDVMVDCGANIGLWTLTAAAAVGPGGRVHAVEASPPTARRLRGHAEQAPWVTVHAVAAGSEAGEARFDLGGQHHNIAQISEAGSEVVPVAPLDDLVAEERVTGMKLDVEGHELAALQGASRLLAGRPWVVVEFHPAAIGVGSLGEWPVHDLLTAAGLAPHALSGAPLDSRYAPRHGYANVLYR